MARVELALALAGGCLIAAAWLVPNAQLIGGPEGEVMAAGFWLLAASVACFLIAERDDDLLMWTSALLVFALIVAALNRIFLDLVLILIVWVVTPVLTALFSVAAWWRKRVGDSGAAALLAACAAFLLAPLTHPLMLAPYGVAWILFGIGRFSRRSRSGASQLGGS